MTSNWKKRYGFRLREDDAELGTFLEQVPHTKTSEVIRQMLSFAYRTMTVEQKELKQFQRLKEDMEILKADQQKHYQEVTKALYGLQETISKGVSISANQSQVNDQGIGDKLDDKAVRQSAEALLSSFGIEE